MYLRCKLPSLGTPDRRKRGAGVGYTETLVQKWSQRRRERRDDEDTMTRKEGDLNLLYRQHRPPYIT